MYAEHRLRDDRGIVLIAVQNQGYALNYASKRLQGDKEIVRIAVRQDGLLILYASHQLQHDKDVVLDSLLQCDEKSTFRLLTAQQSDTLLHVRIAMSTTPSIALLQEVMELVVEVMRNPTQTRKRYLNVDVMDSLSLFLLIYPSLVREVEIVKSCILNTRGQHKKRKFEVFYRGS